MQRQSVRDLPANKSPTGTRCIQITIPDDDEWERALWGEIWRLTRWNLWERNVGKDAKGVAALWLKAMWTWAHCNENPDNPGFAGADDGSDFMIRQNPDNPCLLESSVNGTDWCVFADLSKCTNFGVQPGTGNTPPAPGGGTQQTCTKLNANGSIVLPTLVNAGDTVTLDGATGAGWDGVEGSLPLWRLPNGDHYLGGLDVGLPRLEPTDPLPTANHMKIIARVGSTPVFMELSVGVPATVPGGIANAQISIQVNDLDISNNQGSYDICVTVKNNQDASWLHVFDFRISPYSSYLTPHLALSGQPRGIWVPGNGFTYNMATGDANPQDLIQFEATSPVSTIFDTVTFKLSAALVVGGFWQWFPDGVTDLSVTSVGGADHLTITNSHVGSTLFIGIDTRDGSNAPFVQGFTMSGHGTDPFPGAPTS